MTQKTIRVIIEGKVQGVAYRAWAVATANELGVNGWTRNLNDGTVEVVLSGNKEDLEAMLALCEGGPPAARVEKITSFPHDETLPQGFYQKPTA